MSIHKIGLIQIGTLANKNLKTNKYDNSWPLFSVKTKELELGKKELFKNVCEMFVSDLLNFERHELT